MTTVAFVNSRFPDEASLAEIEPFAARLEKQIGTLDEELALAVRAQSQMAGKALDDLEKAKNAVGELHAKVKGIRSKAEDSEKRVKAVCHDITRLDRAKTNLQATMKALTKASQLLTAVDQLEFLTDSRQYSDAAKILVAVNELNDYFNSHDAVPKIQEMRASVARVKDALTKNVFEDVQQGLGSISDDTFVDDPNYYPDDTQSPEALKGACAVADLLSATTRKQLRKTLINNYMRPYDVIFSAEIDEKDAERRFAWLNRLLDSNQRMFADVFPPSWKMEKLIALQFCQKTAEQYQKTLDSGTVPVPVMVKTLKKTLEFERSLNQRFNMGRARTGSSDLQDRTRGGSVEDVAPPEIPATPGAPVDEPVAEIPTNWKGMISSLFQPFMGSFVRLLSDSVREQVEQAMVEELVETANQQNDARMMRVYPSSAQLFQAIKQTITTMNEYSTGQAFLDLCLAFKVRLAAYADAIERRAIGGSSNAPQSSTGAIGGGAALLPPSVTEKPFDVQAARLLCIAINTADYMTEEIPNLHKAVSKKLDQALADKLDFSPERERFMDVASRAVNALAAKVVSKVEPTLDQIARQNWLAFRESGDQSIYVRQIQAVLEEFVPVIGSAIASAIYFRSFCDSFASAFLRAFQVMVFKIKRVGEAGAQQLFVDCAAIETALLDLPTLGGAKGTIMDTYKIFKKYVETGMRRHKMLFKILSLQVKLSVAVEDFSRLLGPSASLVLFNQMLDMRGVVKASDRAQAIKLAEEGGIPATVPEDEMTEQIRQQLAKEATAAQATATQSSGFANVFSSLGARTAAATRPVAAATTPAPAPAAAATPSTAAKGFTALLGGATKRPNPNPQPPPGSGQPPGRG